MNRVTHFEIQADDPKRAMDFYKTVFGWQFNEWKSPNTIYWMIATAEEGSKEPGINGGIYPRPAKRPPQQFGTNAFVCTVNVANFDETAKKILAAGGVIALPKFAMPKMAWIGYFLDTEGNTFGVYEANTNAI